MSLQEAVTTVDSSIAQGLSQETWKHSWKLLFCFLFPAVEQEDWETCELLAPGFARLYEHRRDLPGLIFPVEIIDTRTETYLVHRGALKSEHSSEVFERKCAQLHSQSDYQNYRRLLRVAKKQTLLDTLDRWAEQQGYEVPITRTE